MTFFWGEKAIPKRVNRETGRQSRAFIMDSLACESYKLRVSIYTSVPVCQRVPGIRTGHEPLASREMEKMSSGLLSTTVLVRGRTDGQTDGERASAALIIARLGSRRFIQLNANAGRRLRGRRGG